MPSPRKQMHLNLFLNNFGGHPAGPWLPETDRRRVTDITYWQKSSENNELKTLIVADGKFWSRDGKFNAKENFKREHDNFVQFQYEYLRYKKIIPSQNNIKVKKQDQSQDYIGNIFFNHELNRLIRLTKFKGSKTSAKVVFDDADKQEIFYSVKTDTNLIYKGTILYQKKDQLYHSHPLKQERGYIF